MGACSTLWGPVDANARPGPTSEFPRGASTTAGTREAPSGPCEYWQEAARNQRFDKSSPAVWCFDLEAQLARAESRVQDTSWSLVSRAGAMCEP